MKIAQIAPIWIRIPPEKYGGSEMICSLLTEELVKMGHEVTLFATKDAITQARLEWVCEKPIGIGNPDIMPTYVHFAHAFSKWKEFDIIHSHGGIFGMIYGPVIPKPLVVTMHNIYLRPNSLEFHYFKNKANYVAISQSQKRIATGMNVTAVVYNAIDLPKYKFETQKENYLLWLSNCVPDKGPDIAIRVAKDLNMKLIMAGKIDKNLPEHVRYFEETIKPHIDGKQIIFYEELTAEEKNNLYGKARCFLFPIRWEEPFGMVMAESMACGTPVVAFRRGSVPEVVKNGVTGFVVDTYEEFLDGVKRVLAGEINPAACRKHVEENFTPQIMAKNYVEVYKSLLKK